MRHLSMKSSLYSLQKRGGASREVGRVLDRKYVGTTILDFSDGLFSLLSKLSDLAIYFTFHNLARSANLPTGLCILLALISSFF